MVAVQCTYSNGAVIAGATCNEQQSPTPMHLLQVILDATKHHVVCLKVHTTTHRVHYRVWLLKNLLLHERPEVAYNTQKVTTTSTEASTLGQVEGLRSQVFHLS